MPAARLVSLLLTAVLASACTGPAVAPGEDRGARGEGVYIPDDQLRMIGPPPAARVVGDPRALPVISLDWAVLGGAVREPTPPISWVERRAADGPVVTRIETTRRPIRVVACHYRDVDRIGVPAESNEAEELCVFDDGWCTYGVGDAVDVTMPAQPRGTYVVIQAAWITELGSDVQLSYAWRVG